jgi:Recombination enhancement, RecA-dependent nuclease
MNLQEWKELVHGLPCVVCFLQTGKRVYGVEAHHLESDRDDLSDWLEVPLCRDHHQGPNGVHGLHRRAFYTRYKLDDLALIAGTIKLFAMEHGYMRHGFMVVQE